MGDTAQQLPRLYRPTWAEIDLSRLKANLRKLSKKSKTPLMLVVKANGYGHGGVEVARAAAPLVKWFGVSSVEEGVALREAGIKRPILILGSLYPFESTMAAIRYGLTPTVASLEGAKLIARAAKAMGDLGPSADAKLNCHLKIDTGMGRVGVRWPAGAQVVEYLRRVPGVRLDGVFTHFSKAESDAATTRRQLTQFRQALKDIDQAGLKVRWRHAANSAGLLKYPAARFDLVRPGLAAYGLVPGFQPVLSLKTRIVFLKMVPKGTPLSYGAHWRAKRPSRIATLPIGYGDGLHRLASLPQKGRRGVSVIIRGRRCPIVGAMTMDMAMVDVTGLPGVSVGDEAVLIGGRGALAVTAADWAKAADTLNYEIVTHLRARIPRVYRG